MKKLFLICFAAVITAMSVAQNIDKAIELKTTNSKMQWWKDAKFGMFIHWGIYSVPAGKWGSKTHYGEWIMHQAKIPRSDYSALAQQFNPTQFSAEDWVKLAKDAGQKYIVITSKHHDGFAMFGSKASPYNIVDATPFKRDILKELADACRKYDMKLGFYYSQAQDWYHLGGAVSGGVEWDQTHVGDMGKYIEQIAIPQVKEILANYGDVAVLWWDTPINMTKEMTQKLADLLRPYPNIITNNRLGADMGGDLETPEQVIPATGFPGRNWEVCMTMNGHWGYNAWDDRWKSTTDLLQKLIDIVSKGGNFLLNVGPDAYGVIPEVCQQNLREMGDWLKINGESIYSTTSSPFPFLSWGRATRKGQILYLHVFDWPKDGKLNVPLTNKISKAYLLADAKVPLKISSGKVNSAIQLPAFAPDKIASVVAIQFEGEPVVMPIPSHRKKVSISSSEDEIMNVNLTDGDPKTVWKAARGEKNATIELDLEKPTSIQCLSLIEPWHPWSEIRQKHELQYMEGSSWKTIFSGENDGTGLTRIFTPVTAQKFRLIVQNEKEAPGINELILFRAE
ncbi:MAG: alpha-L-fucosidase [Prolixibacteraceae bacterium]|nr:alpha-L-fucosidase [Prolixibacteraceae bacterium]